MGSVVGSSYHDMLVMSGVSQNLGIAIYYISALSGMKMNHVGWIGIAVDSLRDDDSWFWGKDL